MIQCIIEGTETVLGVEIRKHVEGWDNQECEINYKKEHWSKWLKTNFPKTEMLIQVLD